MILFPIAENVFKKVNKLQFGKAKKGALIGQKTRQYSLFGTLITTYLMLQFCSQRNDKDKTIDLKGTNKKDSEVFKHFCEKVPKQTHVWS